MDIKNIDIMSVSNQMVDKKTKDLNKNDIAYRFLTMINDPNLDLISFDRSLKLVIIFFFNIFD